MEIVWTGGGGVYTTIFISFLCITIGWLFPFTTALALELMFIVLVWFYGLDWGWFLPESVDLLTLLLTFPVGLVIDLFSVSLGGDWEAGALLGWAGFDGADGTLAAGCVFWVSAGFVCSAGLPCSVGLL